MADSQSANGLHRTTGQGERVMKHPKQKNTTFQQIYNSTRKRLHPQMFLAYKQKGLTNPITIFFI